MEMIKVGEFPLYFDEEERATAELIAIACEKSSALIQEHWGLPVPENCAIYVMTSWRQFLLDAAPASWKLLLRLLLPLFRRRLAETWRYAGGWAQPFGKYHAVGIKPPRLLAAADKRIGGQIFITEEDLDKKVQIIACHELTHAFNQHLKMPSWFNEGLAMIIADKFSAAPTVKPETLQRLNTPLPDTSRITYPRIKNEQALLDIYIFGYWVTRYFDEVYPGLLRELLAQPYQKESFNRQIAATLQIPIESLWEKIGPLVIRHYDGTGGVPAQ